jgi:hypothetical protein
MHYFGEESLEGAAELHCFGRCQPDRLRIYT